MFCTDSGAAVYWSTTQDDHEVFLWQRRGRHLLRKRRTSASMWTKCAFSLKQATADASSLLLECSHH
jgi:hypothetical protein